MTEDELVGWHHRLRGCEFEQTPRNSAGQGSLVHCSPRSLRVGHSLVTEQQQIYLVCVIYTFHKIYVFLPS